MVRTASTAQRNERDLGVFYYWTPEPAQQFFKEVLEKDLKGSGNYGVFGFGCYNGQGGSFLEQNDNLHIVARLTIPVQLESGQYVEASLQGYTGNYVVLSSPIRALGVTAVTAPAGTLGAGNDVGILDERLAASFIWYPQPFGFQAEWNVGRGPALNAAQTAVVEDDLQGGYAQVMYKYDTPCHGTFFPYARYAYYKGGYKSERNAPFAHIDEFETGCEWQMNKQMELTTSYTWTDRTNTTALNQVGVIPYQQFAGQFVRFQFQFNY
ncbi:MAG: porin [Pirellulales bacterium]